MIADLLDKNVEWYRPNPAVDGVLSDNLGNPAGDTLLKRCVPVSIQPASAKQVELYAAFRSLEISHTIYTTHCGPWKRNDVLVYDSRKFTVVGVRNLIERDQVWALDCVEYDGVDGRR